MRVPFHALTLDVHPVRAIAEFQHVLEEPILRVIPLLDTLDIPYAYDIALTDGLFVNILAFLVLRTLIKFVYTIRTQAGEDS
jgi:hypothetical protein